MKNKFLLVFSVFCLLFSTQTLLAQVTTASMSGTVTDKKTKEVIPGVTIIAVHTPTGGQFGVVTDDNGTYSINNMKVGGPYKVTFSFIGYKQQDIMIGSLGLGENTKLNAALAEEGSLDIIEEAVVTGKRDATFDAGRTGATTNINSEQLAALPTLSRSLQDFVRLTPQFSAQANGGISFGGANNRFNSIMIDGAVNNDVFGLNASGTPGGRTNVQPVSLDAVKEIQVLIAPYDVRQSGFVGGGVNAVTRSGTNELEGSAYYFTRSANLTGTKVGDLKFNPTNFKDTQFGFRFGGPIVKNKLFYFFNAELGRRDDPNPNTPTAFAQNVINGATANNSLSDDARGVLIDNLANKFTAELANMRRIMINKYNYDPGDPTESFLNTQNSNKIFARLDWNINNQHTLTVRHNFIDAFVGDIFRSGTNYSFNNSGSLIKNRTNTTVMELQSRLTNKVSNEFRVSYTNINDFRENNARNFPLMTVVSQSMTTSTAGQVFINAGLDAIGGLNTLKQNLIEITDNLTWKKGKHTFVFGTRNELYFFENTFLQNYAGAWRFGSLQPLGGGAIDFSLESGVPDRFQKNYSRTADPRQGVKWGAIQLGVYVQDEWNVSKNLRLTMGVRADLPYMSSTVTRNDLFVKQFGLDNSAKPTAKPLISPRIGFNWDVKNDGKTQVRGGVGLFAGRPPFVWLSNQYSNSGVDFGQINLDANLGTQADISALFAGTTPAQRDAIVSDPNYLPKTQTATSVINLTNPNLRLPQIFRANLGVDRKLPYGFVASFDALYSKTINDMYVRNINIRGQQDVLNNEGRPIFGIPALGPRLIDPVNFTGVYVLENTRGGDQLSLTGKLERNKKGLYTMLAYTYSNATDFASLTSSVAASNFANNITSTNPNVPVQATTDFNLKHRIVGAVSWNIDYSKYASTNIALFYNGQSGRNFSYTVGGPLRDINADGISFNELIYIPRKREDIELTNTILSTTPTTDNAVDISSFGILGTDGNVIQKAAPYTVNGDLQYGALDKFISGEASLKDRRGQFAERNAAFAPWNHRFDLRLMQNIRYNAGIDNKKHTLQFTLDIINVGNLLNKDWGLIQSSVSNPVAAQSYNAVTGNIVYTVPVAVTATSLVTDAAGAPVLVGGRPQVKTATAEIVRNRNISSLSSVWQMQFGVRYIF